MATRLRLAQEILNIIYPVGSIYLSVNNTNPSSLFGGSWVQWGAGKVPVGVDTNDTDFNTVEKTGGSKYLQAHNHYKRVGARAYQDMCYGLDAGFFSGSAHDGYTIPRDSGPVQNLTTGDSGNLQPYITCFMFKRTA